MIGGVGSSGFLTEPMHAFRGEEPMTKLSSPEQLPEMLADLKRQGFYGDIHITFRCVNVTRIVTEQSQVFNSNEGSTRNDNRQR